MARRTKAERIKKLEDRRQQLEKMQERNEAIEKISAQGTDGASTEFYDPQKIQKLLDTVETKLEMEFMSTWVQ